MSDSTPTQSSSSSTVTASSESDSPETTTHGGVSDDQINEASVEELRAIVAEQRRCLTELHSRLSELESSSPVASTGSGSGVTRRTAMGAGGMTVLAALGILPDFSFFGDEELVEVASIEGPITNGERVERLAGVYVQDIEPDTTNENAVWVDTSSTN